MTARLPATAALLAATAVWGSTFIVTKDSLAHMPSASFLTWRFGIAAVALLVARPGSLRALPRTDQWHALLLGVVLAAGFLLQTNGLLHTLAGVSGFLTGASVILTPVVAATFFGEKVSRTGWIAVALSAAGIAGLAGGSSTPSWAGTLLTLGGAACFAVHITGLSQWATRRNAYALTAVSVTVAAILCAAAALVLDGISPHLPLPRRGRPCSTWALVPHAPGSPLRPGLRAP